jgi:hypothetical protein
MLLACATMKQIEKGIQSRICVRWGGRANRLPWIRQGHRAVQSFLFSFLSIRFFLDSNMSKSCSRSCCWEESK